MCMALHLNFYIVIQLKRAVKVNTQDIFLKFVIGKNFWRLNAYISEAQISYIFFFFFVNV